MLFKYIKPLLLFLGLLTIGVSPIHAEDELDYVPLDVTVPTEASITFNEDGSNTVPNNFDIVNNSDIGGIKVTGIEMVSNNSWQLMPLGFDQTKFSADSKQIKMQLSTENSKAYDLSTISKLTIQDMPINILSSLTMNFGIWRAAYSIENKEKAFDMVFTIDWIKEPAIIKFDSDGGTAVDKIITIKDGLDLSRYQPSKLEHVFKGWYDAKDSQQKILNNDLPLNGNIYLKAKWQINQYTTTFDSAGGTVVNTILQDWNSNIDLDAINPTRTGYTFVGWYLDDQQVSGSFTVEKDKTLTAKWDANSYILKFDSQGGSSQSDLTVTYDQNATLPSPIKKGYTFNGWFTGPNATGVKVSTGVYKTASDQQLYAYWTINQYTMSFNSNGGSAIGSIKKDFNSVINLNSYNPSRTGYTFQGWFIGNTKYSGNYTLTDDATLTAKWTANSYTLSFDSQGGSAVSNITVTYDASFSLPSPSKSGYTFRGWYTGANATGTRVDNGTYRTAASQRLYAYWTANNYSLYFDSNGGSAVSGKTVTYGSAIGSLPSSSRHGYTHAGWILGGNWITSSSAYSYTYDTTAVAQWTNSAPVYTRGGAITLYASGDTGKLYPNWSDIYGNMTITDVEEGSWSFDIGGSSVYTGSHGQQLWNSLNVVKIVAPNGYVFGDGESNLAAGASYFSYQGAFNVTYRVSDCVGAKSYFTRTVYVYHY